MPSHKTEDMVSPMPAQEDSEDAAIPVIRVRGPSLVVSDDSAWDSDTETDLGNLSGRQNSDIGSVKNLDESDVKDPEMEFGADGIEKEANPEAPPAVDTSEKDFHAAIEAGCPSRFIDYEKFPLSRRYYADSSRSTGR